MAKQVSEKPLIQVQVFNTVAMETSADGDAVFGKVFDSSDVFTEISIRGEQLNALNTLLSSARAEFECMNDELQENIFHLMAELSGNVQALAEFGIQQSSRARRESASPAAKRGALAEASS